MSYLQRLLFIALPTGSALSIGTAGEVSTDRGEVYWNQYTDAQRLDQAAFESPLFWADIDRNIPGWQTAPKYERFRGFCDNLRKETPGREVELPNGQQLLAQYIFPGIEDEDGTHRSEYPCTDFKELEQLRSMLEKDVAPVARKELSDLLDARPLVGDDGAFAGQESNDGDTWQRAAWYGWQYLSLRGAKKWMPQATLALRKAMGKLGPAHRFVGLARQKQQCEGVEHSDGRNYMLSTLTPLQCPEGCGIIVNGIDATLRTGDSPVILDNTFPHHVYNEAEEDRFCLMSECYHPALTNAERDAIATLFAVKDRFTVVELELAPWGYDDDDLELALKTGAVKDINYWKEIGYDVSTDGREEKKKGKGKGFASKAAKGFGKS